MGGSARSFARTGWFAPGLAAALTGIGVALTLMALTQMAGAQTADRAAPTAAQVVHDLGLQTDLPLFTPPDWHLPQWLRGFLAWIHLPSWMWWLIPAAGIAVILYFLKDVAADLIPGWRRSKGAAWREASPETAEVGVAAMVQAAVTADDLARQERYAEAMHLLLLQSLAEMRQRLDIHIADSLTSREILQKVELSERGRAALRAIIGTVELSHFGERPAGAAEYHPCRENFTALIQALQAARR